MRVHLCRAYQKAAEGILRAAQGLVRGRGLDLYRRGRGDSRKTPRLL